MFASRSRQIIRSDLGDEPETYTTEKEQEAKLESLDRGFGVEVKLTEAGRAEEAEVQDGWMESCSAKGDSRLSQRSRRLLRDFLFADDCACLAVPANTQMIKRFLQLSAKHIDLY